MEYGIIFENQSSELVTALSEALNELGLYRDNTDTLERPLMDALDIYREANGLPSLDFCDPATLRALGIECSGDEIMLLAGYAESLSGNEMELYDICCEVLAKSSSLGITIREAVGNDTASQAEVSPAAVTCAVLSLLNK